MKLLDEFVTSSLKTAMAEFPEVNHESLVYVLDQTIGQLDSRHPSRYERKTIVQAYGVRDDVVAVFLLTHIVNTGIGQSETWRCIYLDEEIFGKPEVQPEANMHSQCDLTIADQGKKITQLQKELSWVRNTVKNHVERLQKSGEFYFGYRDIDSQSEGSLVDDLLRQLVRDRQDLSETLGSLIEHMIVSLSALEMVAKNCYGGNHSRRNHSVHVLEEIIEQAKSAMISDRGDPMRMSRDLPFGRDNWDFRRMAREKHDLMRANEKLTEELRKIGQGKKQEAESDAGLDEDEIPF